jgi:cell division protein FtsW (lipid II flippase)
MWSTKWHNLPALTLMVLELMKIFLLMYEKKQVVQGKKRIVKEKSGYRDNFFTLFQIPFFL